MLLPGQDASAHRKKTRWNDYRVSGLKLERRGRICSAGVITPLGLLFWDFIVEGIYADNPKTVKEMKDIIVSVFGQFLHKWTVKPLQIRGESVS